MGSHTSGSTRHVMDQLRILVRALRISSREAEKRLGISGAQLFVLETLNEIGPSSINALAAATHTDQSSVSVVVSRLVEARLVTRRTSKVDSRRVEARLTAAGRTVLEGAPETPQARIVRALEALPEKRRSSLAMALANVAALAGLETEPKMFFEDEKKKKK